MNLLDALRFITNRLPLPREDDDERLHDAELRVNALDALIGAKQAQRTRERHRRDTEAEHANR